MIGIYKITNLLNNKIYIGQSIHIERRWIEHCIPSARSVIGKAIQKYGKQSFSFQVLEECTPDQLDEREEYYIHFYNSIVPNGYNIMDWVDNKSVCFNIDQQTLEDIKNDIQYSSLTFSEIAEKYDLSTRTIIRINQGQTHYSVNDHYPLRDRVHRETSFCIDCGEKITTGAIRCSKCNAQWNRKAERPTRNELKQLIRTTPFTTLGKMYGVTDNAIRKWCKSYNLPAKSAVIKQMTDAEWLEI